MFDTVPVSMAKAPARSRPLDAPRTVRERLVHVRLSDEEYGAARAAAGLDERVLSDWVRRLIRQACGLSHVASR